MNILVRDPYHYDNNGNIVGVDDSYLKNAYKQILNWSSDGVSLNLDEDVNQALSGYMLQIKKPSNHLTNSPVTITLAGKDSGVGELYRVLSDGTGFLDFNKFDENWRSLVDPGDDVYVYAVTKEDFNAVTRDENGNIANKLKNTLVLSGKIKEINIKTTNINIFVVFMFIIYLLFYIISSTVFAKSCNCILIYVEVSQLMNSVFY
ncbi:MULTISPECIES: hypothetical protein [Bacillus cereus group]|nr:MULTISPECIES: hypothetical protein [Bacillus cereus group]ADK08186.1 protective antigen-related protein [Bacillus cereus biovar anthracis str. CI]AAD32415.1 pXO1-111 [Bacillus anthracis]MCY2913445.1 hypothetical protein [Bacillus anthracis]UTW24824.1 hypothetical protein M1D19_28075 [Bacillus anthracis]WAA53903.1 hypothetical protein OM985_28165 [Bacillus anthracis]